MSEKLSTTTAEADGIMFRGHILSHIFDRGTVIGVK